MVGLQPGGCREQLNRACIVFPVVSNMNALRPDCRLLWTVILYLNPPTDRENLNMHASLHGNR